MSSSYVSGFFVGLVFVLVFALIVFLRKKSTTGCEHYDERQQLIRGKGYKISFMTVLILNIIYAMFFYGMTKSIISPQLAIMTISFVGILIYTVYCIFNDAYMQVGQSIGKWVWIIVFVILSNGYVAFTNMGRIREDGTYAEYGINLLIVVVFTVMLAAILVKHLIDKRGDANEES